MLNPRGLRIALALLLYLLQLLSQCHGRANGAATTTTTSTTTTAGALTEYNMSVVTWNLAEKKPSEPDCAFLKEFRGDDFVVVGVQECENIKPRREEGHRSRAWRALQVHRRPVWKRAHTVHFHPHLAPPRVARRAGQAVHVPRATPPGGHAGSPRSSPPCSPLSVPVHLHSPISYHTTWRVCSWPSTVRRP